MPGHRVQLKFSGERNPKTLCYEKIYHSLTFRLKLHGIQFNFMEYNTVYSHHFITFFQGKSVGFTSQSWPGFGSLLSETPFTLETPAAESWRFAQCLPLTTQPRTMAIHNNSSQTGYWVMPLGLNTNKSVWKLSSRWEVGNRNAGFQVFSTAGEFPWSDL